MLTDVPLNPLTQGHRRGGAAHARTVETDTHQPVRRNIHQFHIAPVGLNRRTHRVQNTSDTTKDLRQGFSVNL